MTVKMSVHPRLYGLGVTMNSTVQSELDVAKRLGETTDAMLENYREKLMAAGTYEQASMAVDKAWSNYANAEAYFVETGWISRDNDIALKMAQEARNEFNRVQWLIVDWAKGASTAEEWAQKKQETDWLQQRIPEEEREFAEKGILPYAQYQASALLAPMDLSWLKWAAAGVAAFYLLPVAASWMKRR